MIKKMMFILDSYNFFSLITRLNEFRRVKNIFLRFVNHNPKNKHCLIDQSECYLV